MNTSMSDKIGSPARFSGATSHLSRGVVTRLVWLAVTCLVLGGCTFGGSLSHRLDIVIPASVSSIEEGKLVALLFAYNPGIADKAADELDKQEVPFSHRQGTRTLKSVTLRGVVPRGFDTYVAVEGCERRGGNFVYRLWDAQEGVGMPTNVQMRTVDNETEALCYETGELR